MDNYERGGETSVLKVVTIIITVMFLLFAIIGIIASTVFVALDTNEPSSSSGLSESEKRQIYNACKDRDYGSIGSCERSELRKINFKKKYD